MPLQEDLMRRIPVSLAAFLLLALSPKAVRADLSFATTRVDAGEVRSGAPLKQRFAFVNEGPNVVEIIGLQTSCGCVKPQLATRTYATGEKGELILEVHTLSQSPGLHSWRLQVAYRDGSESREKELLVTGQIVTEVTAQPAALTLFTGGALAHDITLTDLRERPLSVIAVHTSSPYLRGEVKHTGRDDAGHRLVTINVTLDERCPEGRFEETIAIGTDDADYRELTVPVTIVKRPRQKVSAAPSAVSLAAARGQAVPSRIVLLRPASEEAVVVERVEADDPAIACTWAQGPENCATLKVGIDRAKLPPDGLRSAIHVHISKPVSETITVPVNCRVD